MKGVAEHKTYLPNEGVDKILDFAIDEAIDQLTYLLTLRQLLDER
jgi:hypothetical protein